MTVSSVEYMQGKGTKCPKCYSNTLVEVSNFEYTEYDVTHEVSCENCYAHWTEVYVLSGYINLGPKDKGEVALTAMKKARAQLDAHPTRDHAYDTLEKAIKQLEEAP